MLVEESVYSLIPPAQSEKERSAMYRSKHSTTVVPPTASTFGFHGTAKVLSNVAGEPEHVIAAPHPSKRAGATFGKSVSGTIDPHAFLKKMTGAEKAKSTSDRNRSLSPRRSHSSEAKRAAVPKREEKPIMGLKTDKNFVVANAVEAILAAPKRPPASADRAVERQTYGQLPEYLQEIKAQLKSAASAHAHDQERAAAASKAQELSDAEVNELRDQLVARRAVLNKQYLTLSVNLQTSGQLKRKEHLERDLQAVENAIAKLSKKRIVVVDD
jgi:hypothetical protein